MKFDEMINWFHIIKSDKKIFHALGMKYRLETLLMSFPNLPEDTYEKYGE